MTAETTENPPATYCALMEEVKQRLAVIRRFTHAETTFGRDDFDTETIATHFRKCLESIAFGSLVAHRAAYEAVHADIQSRWRAKEILARVEKIHPNFYPQPMARHADGPGRWRLAPLASGYLSRAEFVTLYETCGDMLHLWNPFRPGPRRIDFGHSIEHCRERIEALLDFHVIWMSGGGGGWLIELARAEDGCTHAMAFAPTEEGAD